MTSRFSSRKNCLCCLFVFTEKQNFQLKTDLESESNEVKRLRKVDEDILNLKVELNEVQIKLRETSLELDKTQAKNRSLVKHEQVS